MNKERSCSSQTHHQVYNDLFEVWAELSQGSGRFIALILSPRARSYNSNAVVSSFSRVLGVLSVRLVPGDI